MSRSRRQLRLLCESRRTAAYRTLYGIAGSYIAAVLAPDRRMAHALALGGVGFVASLVGAIAACSARPEYGPLWYLIALVAMALPNAWLGGWLGTRPSRR